MKRYVRSNEENNRIPFDLRDFNIESIVFVSDARDYRPGPNFVNASSSSKVDYSTLTREQILQLPKKERDGIHDIDALRKLNLDELTIQQRRDVTQANKVDTFKRSPNEVNSVLRRISEDDSIFVFPTQKNQDFNRQIASLGGEVTGSDVANIIKMLKYQDYQNSKYSYMDWDWCSELMVFQFHGSYAFSSRADRSERIEASDFKIYIKLDVETKKNDCYVALSFHDPEYLI